MAGRLGSRKVLLIAGGMGVRCAARATEALIAEWSPDAIVITGVAGALSADLRRGDVLAASRVQTESGRLAPPILLPNTPTGTLLSVDRVLVTALEKEVALRALGALQEPAAVEMETAGAAAVAERLGVPWGAVRAISDGAEESLPMDFNRLRAKDGDLPIASVALAAMRQPGCIPGLIRLASGTNLAAKALARALITTLR